MNMATEYDGEVAKEFLRNCFHDGSLDLGDRKRLESFLRIFAGEMEAVIALEQASAWLEESAVVALVPVARPSRETFSEHAAWKSRILNPKRRRA
jgi:hypothetical protein